MSDNKILMMRFTLQGNKNSGENRKKKLKDVMKIDEK